MNHDALIHVVLQVMYKYTNQMLFKYKNHYIIRSLSDFVDVLQLKVFTDGILDFSFYQKILSTDRKYFLHVFGNKML